MKIKKIALITASIIIGVTTLTACQGSGSDSQQEQSIETSEISNETEETPEPPIHTLEKTETGAVHLITASDTMKPSDLQDLKDIVKLISEEDSLNQPPDPVAFYGEKPGLVLLQENRDKYKVIYLENDKGAGLEFTSGDPEIVKALHQWVDHGEVPSFGSGDLGVYGPSY
jgi:predicted small secreted protein